MTTNKLAIIGGSGLYDVEEFKDRELLDLNTSWGKPSDKILKTIEQITTEEVFELVKQLIENKWIVNQSSLRQIRPDFGLGNLELKIIHTPGHTAGCISIYSKGYVFTGDTLFIKGAGRTDFQGGSSVSSFTSIKDKLYKLPNDTVVYPAHNYEGITSSTIYQEKKWNESVNSKTKLNEYIQRELKKERPYPKKFDIAVPANTYCGDSTKVDEKLKL